MTRDGTVQFRNDIYGRDDRPAGEMSDEQSALLSAARAGGFVQQASPQSQPTRPRAAVQQASHLDSR
jgi:hypothetical protein